MLDLFFHVHDATDVLMFVITVNSASEDQLQHSAKLLLVTFLSCRSINNSQLLR